MFSLILHACLASLALAAPVATEITTQDITPVGQYGGGVVGFIVLILDILVWIELFKSSRPASHKLLWALLVFLFPVGGIILYWIFSDRAKWNSSSNGYEQIA